MKNLHRWLVWIVLGWMGMSPTLAQNDTTGFIKLSSYVNPYFDFIPEGVDGYKEFSGPDPQSGAVGLDIAQLGVEMEWKGVRSKVTLQAGDIPLAVWDPNFRYLQEAYAGFRIAPKWWVDAGLFLTHIGGEGLTPQGQMFLTNAIVSFHEPYFQAGVRLSWAASDKFAAEAWLLNGYATIEDHNNSMAGGWKFNLTPSTDWTIWYSGYAGDEKRRDSTRLNLLWYNNAGFYFQRNGWGVKLSGDFSIKDTATKGQSSTAYALGGIFGLRIPISEQFGVSTRYEVFDDPGGYLSGVFHVKNSTLYGGLQCQGVTLGPEWIKDDFLRVRMEGRYLFPLSAKRIEETPQHPDGFRRWEGILSVEVALEKVWDLVGE